MRERQVSRMIPDSEGAPRDTEAFANIAARPETDLEKVHLHCKIRGDSGHVATVGTASGAKSSVASEASAL
jgi:hypothetical protein